MWRLVGTSCNRLDGEDSCQDPGLSHVFETYPLSFGVLQVQRAPVIRKVRDKDAQVDKTGEDASANSPNGGWSDLSEVDWSHHNRLTNTQACYEATSVDSSQVAIVAHEDCDANNPKDA